MTAVSVVIPTVTGRERWLDLCLRGYQERTQGADLELIVVKDRPTCGLAWRDGAGRATGDYVHLTADDIVPGTGWLEPCLEAVERGGVPCGLVVRPVGHADAGGALGDDGMPLDGNPVPDDGALEYGTSYFFSRDDRGAESVPDWHETRDLGEYPSVPFCSREQWDEIAPMIAPQYGGDKWFGYRAHRAGIRQYARHGAVFYHYAADAGREADDGWTWVDRIDFDMCVALPDYVGGRLDPGELHPEHDTLVGRDVARAWRMLHTPPPWHWQTDEATQWAAA